VISLGLIATALVILHGRSRDAGFRIPAMAWVWLVGGAVLTIISFTIDPLTRSFGVGDLMASHGQALTNGRDYVPETFPWPWFMAGVSAAAIGIMTTWRSIR
jgi:hypothetical protein